jgi:hypothetical protein
MLPEGVSPKVLVRVPVSPIGSSVIFEPKFSANSASAILGCIVSCPLLIVFEALRGVTTIFGNGDFPSQNTKGFGGGAGRFLPKGVSANCIGAGLAPEAPGANYL